MNTCPIWGTEAEVKDIGGRAVYDVHSARAGGHYTIAIEVIRDNTDLSDDTRRKLTTWIIDQNRLGNERPLITSKVFDSLEIRPLLPIHTRAERLLIYFESKLKNIGDKIPWFTNIVSPDGHDKIISEMLAYSESSKLEEIDFLMIYLLDLNFISMSDNEFIKNITLTGAGYNYLNELRNKRVDSSQAFVAMWFDDSMTDAYENGIKAAIERCGYKPMKVDEQEYLGPVPDKIIAEIRRSRFLIADFTYGEKGIRGGVYYEAGFAYGLDIPVIYTCKSGSENGLHFDTSHLNHIIWKTPEDLREKLINRIGAVIGDGPLKHETNKE